MANYSSMSTYELEQLLDKKNNALMECDDNELDAIEAEIDEIQDELDSREDSFDDDF